MKYSVKSPTRVDLAGGTLDLWPLYMFVGGAKTINLAISIFTYADLEIRKDSSIEIISEDVGLKKFYIDYGQMINDPDPKVAFFKVVLDHFKPTFGFTLKTKSESPVGGGLGGSSSLMISMLKAFSQALGKKYSSSHELVHLAHNLEARILVTPTGTQDYYPAVTGGINILEYSASGVRNQILNVKQDEELHERFLLVYTGRAHHSGLNNFEVLKNSVEKNARTIRALSQIRLVAEELAAQVTHGNWNQLTALFEREYEARLQLAEAFSSPEIETLRTVSLKAGAEAIKICGAGGGGCVMVWCKPGSKSKIAQACRDAGFEVLTAVPVAGAPFP